MSYKAAIAAAVLTVASSPLYAQQFTGGELGVEYNTFVDGIDLDGTSYFAGVEMAFGKPYALSLNLANFDIDGGDGAASATLHGIYHLSQTASVGAYYAISLEDDVDVTRYGIEGGTTFLGGTVDGYLGRIEAPGGDAVAFGFGSDTPFGTNFAVFTDFDLVSDEDVAGTTSEVGVSYQIPNGPELYLQAGRASVFVDGGSASEAYVGIGAEITFGAARGTTFESR